MKFSENIRLLREKKSARQEDIAKEIGVSTHTYQKYEYEQQEPRMSTLIALADYFDISLDELVGRER